MATKPSLKELRVLLAPEAQSSKVESPRQDGRHISESYLYYRQYGTKTVSNLQLYNVTMATNVLNISLGIKSCFLTQMNEWNQLDDDDDTHDLSDVSLAQAFRVKVYICL